MTKIAQCNKCRIGKGVHCEHYKPTDDSDCSHFVLGIDCAADNREAFIWKFFWYISIAICWIIGICMGEWVFAYIGGVTLFLTVFLLHIIVLLKKNFLNITLIWK